MAQATSTHTIDLSKKKTPLATEYDTLLQQIQSLFSADDLQVITLDDTVSYLFIETIVDMKRLYNEVIEPLQTFKKKPKEWKALFTNGKEVKELERVATNLMNGHVVLVHRKLSGRVISFSIAEFKARAVENPQLERILFGPKDSFVEDIDTNISLLRRHNKDVNLTITYYTIGERSKTKVALIYFRDIANPTWVKQIEKTLKQIHIDKVMSQKELLELIIGRNQTVFPLYELIENPTRASHFLHTGRILLLIDGTPFGAMVPMLFLSMFYASEFFTQGNVIAILVRLLRFFAAGLALLLPAFYVALVGVNTGVVPTELGALIAGDRTSIPYPIVVEILALFLILDIFLESTAYVPGNIGAALNIVGSLVIGQAAAQANLVSNVSIIIIAITAIGTYLTLHQLSYALRFWKYPLVIAAALLGFYGIICCLIVMIGHLCHLTSLGVPYMSPLAPLRVKDLFHLFFPVKDISKRRERSKMWQTQDRYYQSGDGND